MKQVRAMLKPDGRLEARGKTRKSIVGRIDSKKVDATGEAVIARQIAADEADARGDAAAYARRVRKRTGLTQAAFAGRIGVPLDTVRNWEQGKRSPAGPARALLKVLDRSPETALAALK
ncbi:MAG: helix-turn-helix domain-containing protein [Alphaproteobacteria bacterium]|jgi:putative transcriptional regulator|nr:helix-turn-helix domain-containing protein [Alphaproteobacteria bacterium]